MEIKRRKRPNFGHTCKTAIPSRRSAARDLAIVVKAYFVYMMTNRTRIVLYTGVTNDLARRVWEHENGTFRGFTKRYRLTILVYPETYSGIGDAIDRDKEIKGWRRSKKNALVETRNPKWVDLSPTLYQQLRDPSPRFAGSG